MGQGVERAVCEAVTALKKMAKRIATRGRTVTIRDLALDPTRILDPLTQKTKPKIPRM
jgi:hypothetical protein